MSADAIAATLVACGLLLVALVLGGFLLGAVNERDRLREDLAVQRPDRARAERTLRRLISFWEPDWHRFLEGKGDSNGDAHYGQDVYDVIAEDFVDIYVAEGPR